jgi:hypothetical protein
VTTGSIIANANNTKADFRHGNRAAYGGALRARGHVKSNDLGILHGSILNGGLHLGLNVPGERTFTGTDSPFLNPNLNDIP